MEGKGYLSQKLHFFGTCWKEMAKNCVIKWRHIRTANRNCSAWVLLCFQAAPGPAGWFSASEVDISVPNTMGGERWPPLKSFKVARTLSLSTAWAGHWNSHLLITWETSQFRSEQVLNLSHLHPLEIQSTESSLESKQLMMEEEEAAATSE